MSNDWQLLSPNGAPNPGAPVSGGGGTPLTGYKDILDARRSAAAPKTPDAEYPDGYLGTINTRRADRLLTSIKGRLTERSYQRGVHKGEKVDRSDYYWTPEFNPDTGLQAEARGLKWTATGSTVAEQVNHMGKNHLIPPEQLRQFGEKVGVKVVEPVSPDQAAKMARLLPSWR